MYRSIKTVRKLLIVGTVAMLLGVLLTDAHSAQKKGKPQPPLQVSIAPVDPSITPETIKAGDVVDFKVVATSMVDTAEMRIQVTLSDGAEHVSGDLSWVGPAAKKDAKQISFSVRVPATDIGKIEARLTITTDGAKPLSRMAQYLLLTGEQQHEQREDQKAQKNLKSTNPARKDSKGKDVIEYR